MAAPTPSIKGFLQWLALFALVTAASHDDDPVRPLVLGANLAVFLLAAHAAVLAHEAAHATVAAAVGLRAYALAAGTGPKLVERWLGGMHVQLHALPGAGVTFLASPTDRWLRLRLLPTYAAGAAANLAVAAVVKAASGGEVRDLFWADYGFNFDPLAAIFFVNLVAGVTALVPSSTRSSFTGVRTATDGLRLLRLPFLSADQRAAFVRIYPVQEALRRVVQERYAEAAEKARAILVRAPEDPTAKTVLADALIGAHEYAAARDLYLEVLPHPRLAAVRFMIANNAAWADVMLGRAELLAEADTLSAEAIAGAPNHPPVAGTRGAVLAELGRVEEAIPLLERAFAKNATGRNRAYNACALAMVAARRGDAAGAARWVEKAERLDASCRLLERARAAIRREAAIVDPR